MALLLKAAELRGLISLQEAIEAVRQGYRDQGEAPGYSVPRSRMQHEDRRVTVHSGGCQTLGVAGTFIHVERFTFHGGAQQYAGAGKRVYVVYDSETAALRTIIVGSLPLFDFEPEEDWYGTETPITSAVGTDLLARPDSRVLGLYGTGRQARRHLVTLCAIRPIEEVRIYSRNAENRAAFVARMQDLVSARLIAVDTPEEVAKGADVICCATGSNLPVLKGAWLEPGQHITSTHRNRSAAAKARTWSRESSGRMAETKPSCMDGGYRSERLAVAFDLPSGQVMDTRSRGDVHQRTALDTKTRWVEFLQRDREGLGDDEQLAGLDEADLRLDFGQRATRQFDSSPLAKISQLLLGKPRLGAVGPQQWTHYIGLCVRFRRVCHLAAFHFPAPSQTR